MSRLDEYFAKANRGSQTTSSVSASGDKPASNMDAYFAKAGKPVRTNPLNLYTEALKGSQGQSTMQTPYADAAAQTKQSGTQNLYAQAAENAKKSGTNNSFLHGIAGIFEKAAAGAKEGLRTGLNEMGYRAQAAAPLNAADDAYYKAMWEQTTGQKTGVEIPKDTRTQQQKELDEFMGVADLYSDSARAMQRAADKEYERLDNEGLSTAFKRDGTYQAKVDERYADLGPKWQRAMNIAGSVGNQALPIIGRIAGTALLGEKGGEAFQSFLFFNQASGAAIEEALEDGASWDKALTYGTVIGSIEAATEAAGDMANKVTIKAAGKYLPKEQFTRALIGTLTGNKTMRTALTILGQMHGEGLEEVASDLVSPFAKSIYNGKTLGENWMNDVTLQGLWESYLAGAISGGFLSGIGGAVNGQFRAQNESYANETVNAKIEEARASMKENGLFNRETREKIIDAGTELGALETQQQTAAKEAREHMQMIREMQRALRGDAGAQERISRMQEGTYTAGAQNAPEGAQRAQNEGNSTTPAAAINIQEGMNNGQSTYHREESGAAYVGSRGQAAEGAEGGLQALAGGRTEVQRGVGTDAQADLRQVTPAQLGIRDGGTEAVTVVDAQRLGGEAKSAYDAVMENGLEPVAVRGAIQVGDGYANAYTESGKVFFRVDAVDSRGNAISPEMLVQHEMFHNYASEEVISATDEVIRESMTAEEYDAMREAYKADYAGVYDFANMSVDEIERLLTEEIAADAYAGLNWFSGDAPVQETVRAETERNAPARRAEAQQETTGPPEGRGAIVVLPDGKKYVQADRQVIFGDDPDSWADQIEGYINRKIRNGEDVILTTDSGDVLKITKDTAGKASFRNYVTDENGHRRLMTDSEYEAKLNAEAHIDELVQVSEKKNNTPVPDELGTNGKPLHGGFANNGWFYRKAWFQDFDGKYYLVTISTADGDNGVVVYNVGDMKRRGSPANIHGSSDSVTETGAQQGKSSSTVTIRQTEGNSQENSSGKASAEVENRDSNNEKASFDAEAAKEFIRSYTSLRRVVEERTKAYQNAIKADDPNYDYTTESKWISKAEQELRAGEAQFKEAQRVDRQARTEKKRPRSVKSTKRDIMQLFSTDRANRTDVERVLNRNIGEMMAQGEIRGDALDTLVNELLQTGSVVSSSKNSPWIDETYESIRSDLKGGKLYVSKDMWRDFSKDEARELRERARAAGITLSDNRRYTPPDVRNMELAEKYGEALFPTDISAPDMLRKIVDRAAKGVSEKQTLADRLWDEARLEGAGRDQQEAYDRMVGALRDQTEVILREFAEDNHLTLREQTKQGSGNETGTKSETEQRRERLQALAEQDRREAERLRARENLGAGQRFVPNKSSGEVYRELMGKGKSEVKVQMTGFLKGTPKESTFKVEVKPTPIGGYYEATVFHDGHKADTLVRALKETAARDAAEEVITMANKNFSEENYQRAKKFEAEKAADEDARIAELFGDPEQLDSTEPSPKSSDAAETENTAAGTTIAATTEKVTSEVIKAERNFREDFEKITSGAMRMFVNAGDTVRRIAKATGSKSLEGYYFNAGAYSQRAGNWIAKGGARTDIDGHRIGASLADTLAPMRKNETKYRDFQLYLLHMHNVDRMKYDNSGELERIKENLRWVKEKYPELRELSNEELRRIANSDSDSPVVRQAAHEIYLAAHNGEAPSLTSAAEGAAYALELERQRAIVEKQGLKPVFGYDVTADDSQTAAQLLEAKNPEFKEWAKEVYRYSDDLIRYRVEAGLITPEFANALKKRYPHYIPTFREEGTNSKRARSARRNGGIVVSNAIGRAVGSDGVLLPLHTALSRKTVSTMRNAGLNQFGLALVREYDGNQKATEKYIWNVAESEYTPTEAASESDEDYKPVFENVFSVKDNGKAYDITMDEGLTAAMKAFEPDRFASYGAAKAMKKLNDLFKALCTGYNPFFMVRNGVRDWQDAGFYSTDWKTWEKMYWSAWNQIRKNGEIWQQYKALGGSYASMLDYTTGMVKEPKNKLGKAAAWYENIGQQIEAAPRLAEFMTILANKGGSKTVDGVKTGKFTQSDLMEAMLGAADITTNFARGGSVTKALNRYLVPFLNPSIQGFDKFIRNATETRSVKAAGSLILKAALMGIAPALLNALAYRDDDEWDDIPANTKANYYLIKLPEKFLGSGYWVKIPKGRAVAVLGTLAVYGKEKLDGEDVKFSDVFEVIKSNIAPTDIFNQNIATAWTQTKLFNPDNPGTTWYGGNIESDRLQNYRPGERYDEKTDELSKWLGKTFNLSPKKINYLLDQYSGVIGDILLPLMTPATSAKSKLLAAPMAAFTIDTTSTNKTTGKYYDLLDDLKYDANDGDIGAGITRKYVSHAGDEVNDYYQQIREIQNDKELSDAEKNRIVRALKGKLIERQKEIIAQVEPYREAVNDYLKAHPELSTDNDAAIAEYAEQYEITEDQAESRMDAIVYREANREVFGAEYALRTYNADVYDKARAAYAKGVSYDTYYDYYFATKEMHADKDENGKSISGSKKAKVVEYINSLDIPPEQKDALYVAAGYTAKSARNQKWNGGSGGSGGRRGRGKRTALKAPTPKAPEIIIPKSGTASSAKAGGTSKTPKVSGNVIADFTKTASGTDIQKAVKQAKRKALKAGNRTVYVEEGSPIDYFLKYGKLPSLK